MFKLPKIELFKIISVGCKMLNEKNEKDKSKEGLKCQINKVVLDGYNWIKNRMFI